MHRPLHQLVVKLVVKLVRSGSVFTSAEQIRIRQNRSLQQFASLDSEDAVMKVAFLAVIVFVLSLQGSEALPSGGLTVIVDGLLTLLNGALITVRNTVQRVLDSKYPSQQCKVVDVLPDVHKLKTIGSALRVTAKVNLKCPAKVQCSLSASANLGLTKLADVTIDCPFANGIPIANDIPVPAANDSPVPVANDIPAPVASD